MSRRKATPPPVPDKPHQADPPAAVRAEAFTLRTLRDSEVCASLPGRTKELLLHGDGPGWRFVLDEATGGAQADELWDRLNQANEVKYALWRRLNQAHQAVCLAESNGDLLLRDVQRLVEEQWGWGIAGLRHASTWLQSEYGLTAEQADALPLPELRARLRAKSAGASGGGPVGRPAKRKTGRPKKTEKDSATKVVAALSKHHGYDEGGSVTNREPATNPGLARKYGLSANALSRFLAAKLGKDGHKQYVVACRDGKIGVHLALWNRELPGRLANLLPHESGREDDD